MTATLLFDRFSGVFGDARGADRPDPAPKPARWGDPRYPAPKYSQDGLEMFDGSVIEWPDADDAAITVRDASGESLARAELGTPDWDKLALDAFGVTAADYPACDDCGQLLAGGDCESCSW